MAVAKIGARVMAGAKLRGRAAAGFRVIAVNDSWRIAPFADALYFCDKSWWDMQQARNHYAVSGTSFHDLIYKGFWVTGSPKFHDHPQVRYLRFTGESGLEEEPTGLRTGHNSGYQAINLAVHFGAKKIVLLGFDMRVVNGRTHWHDEPRQSAAAYGNDIFPRTMLPHFGSLVVPLAEHDVEIVNATPDSAITCFPSASLKDVLAARYELDPEQAATAKSIS